MKSYEFLFWAYNVIWIVISGYLLTMVFRMRGLDERLGRLERELERDSQDCPRPQGVSAFERVVGHDP